MPIRLHEVIEKKRDLEAKITGLLQGFEAVTFCSVRDVSLEHMMTTRATEGIAAAKVSVDLPDVVRREMLK